MAEATQRLYIPALGGIYSAVSDFAEPILRIALGGILIPHGCQKLFGMFGGMGLTANAALFERIGYSPGMFWGTLVGLHRIHRRHPAGAGAVHPLRRGRRGDLHDRGGEIHLGQGLLLEQMAALNFPC